MIGDFSNKQHRLRSHASDVVYLRSPMQYKFLTTHINYIALKYALEGKSVCSVFRSLLRP